MEAPRVSVGRYLAAQLAARDANLTTQTRGTHFIEPQVNTDKHSCVIASEAKQSQFLPQSHRGHRGKQKLITTGEH
jgi:hypothetical protein